MNSKVYYFPSAHAPQKYYFHDILCELLQSHWNPGEELQILCIGTDKVTGDSLGPMVGHKLTHLLTLAAKTSPSFLTARLQNPSTKNILTPVRIIGTLKNPVHAVNLKQTLRSLNPSCSCTIVIDASLGYRHHLGCATLCDQPLSPGEGVNKKLPSVGHISITGIVGTAKSSSSKSQLTLRQVPLYDLITLTDFIAEGIMKSLYSLCLPTVVEGRNGFSHRRNSLFFHNVN